MESEPEMGPRVDKRVIRRRLKFFILVNWTLTNMVIPGGAGVARVSAGDLESSHILRLAGRDS